MIRSFINNSCPIFKTNFSYLALTNNMLVSPANIIISLNPRSLIKIRNKSGPRQQML